MAWSSAQHGDFKVHRNEDGLHVCQRKKLHYVRNTRGKVRAGPFLTARAAVKELNRLCIAAAQRRAA